MTTYNSYEEAKIANPNSEIVTTGDNWSGDKELKGKFEALNSDPDETHILSDDFWVKCSPADYCQTYNQCEEFKVGMVVLERGLVGEISVVSAAILNTAKADPLQRDSWDSYYILRAAALEKPKRVKVEYVKCDLSLIEKIEILKSGERLYLNMSGSTWICEKDMKSWEIGSLEKKDFYRRVETEITERDEFITSVAAIGEDTGITNTGLGRLAEMLYDSGKFKLVEGE